jgi:GGDEF domain-containing protein
LKTLNDTNGHKAGDEYLATLGKAIKLNIRSNDRAYRVGGDEFIVIMQCTESEADRKVRQILSNFRQLWANKYQVSGSFAFGIASSNLSIRAGRFTDIEKELADKLATAPNAVEKFDAIINAADARMYKQKNEMKLRKQSMAFNETLSIEAKKGNTVAKRILDHRTIGAIRQKSVLPKEQD